MTFDTQKLTLTKAEDGGLLEGNLFTDKLTSPYVLTWEKGDQTADNTKNGTLAVLTFKIKDSAAEGVSPITATASDAFSAELGPVTFSVTDGGVNVMRYFPGDVNSDGAVELLDVTVLRRFIAGWSGVTLDQAAADVSGDGEIGLDDAVILRRHLAGWPGYELPYTPAQTAAVMRLSNDLPVFTVSNVIGQPGERVTVDVTLQGNPGIVAAGLEVAYDTAKLRLVGAENTDLLPGALFGDDLAQMPYRLTWEEGTKPNVEADGVVARLTFEVLEACAETVTITAYRGHNYALEPVIFNTVHGSIFANISAAYADGEITVEDLPGDVLVMAAAYEDGQMVWVSDAAHTDTVDVPKAAQSADELLLFFLRDGWKPVGSVRELR